MKPTLALPSQERVLALLSRLLEVQEDNSRRLTRMETRMVKMMISQGLDQEGKRSKQ